MHRRPQPFLIDLGLGLCTLGAQPKHELLFSACYFGAVSPGLRKCRSYGKLRVGLVPWIARVFSPEFFWLFPGAPQVTTLSWYPHLFIIGQHSYMAKTPTVQHKGELLSFNYLGTNYSWNEKTRKNYTQSQATTYKLRTWKVDFSHASLCDNFQQSLYLI